MKAVHLTIHKQKWRPIALLAISWLLVVMVTKTFFCGGNNLSPLFSASKGRQGFSFFQLDAISAQKDIASETVDEPVIYVVTPTHFRPTQRADLIRLGNTLKNVPRVHWIVVEDLSKPSDSVFDLLSRSKVWKWTHMGLGQAYGIGDKQVYREIDQRNAGIAKVVELTQDKGPNRGVLYFADDSNAYDLQLFEEMRNIRRVGCWAVGFSGGNRYERCTIDHDTSVVTGFVSGYMANRKFVVDMAGFAVNVDMLFENRAQNLPFHFSHSSQPGHAETDFVELFIDNISLLEARGNCTKVWVWQTRTATRAVDSPPQNEREKVSMLV